MPKSVLEQRRVEYRSEHEAFHQEHPRPTTREACLPGGSNEARPCPYVSCKYHLYLDVDVRSGTIQYNASDPAEMWETCALDVADRGVATLEEVGTYLGVVRERVRQIEQRAKQRVYLAVVEAGAGDAFQDLLPASRRQATELLETDLSESVRSEDGDEDAVLDEVVPMPQFTRAQLYALPAKDLLTHAVQAYPALWSLRQASGLGVTYLQQLIERPSGLGAVSRARLAEAILAAQDQRPPVPIYHVRVPLTVVQTVCLPLSAEEAQRLRVVLESAAPELVARLDEATTLRLGDD